MKTLIHSFAILALAACAKKDAATGASTGLEGKWKSACTGDDINYPEFSGSAMRIYYELYESSACSGALKAVGTQLFSFVLGSPNKLDFTQTGFTYVMKTQDLVDYANSHALCGLTNWQLNVSQSIADKTCDLDGLPTANGKTYYSIYQVDTSVTPNVVQLGTSSAGHDGSSEEKRFTVLSTTKLAKQ